MKLTLFDTNIEMIDAWKEEFNCYPEVEVINKPLKDLRGFDYIVTAGNSYAIMNGGIDLAVRDLFGIELQDNIQWFIVNRMGGMLPVGQNIVIPVQSDITKNIIYAPTMRVPQQVSYTNVFITFDAILNNEFIKENTEIACCGLCSGTGRVPYNLIAETMKLVYEHYRIEVK